MSHKQYEIGMIGLGVMGRNLMLNMADHGFAVIGYDKDPAKVASLQREAENREVDSTSNLKQFIHLLRRPLALMLLVPAGAPVDSVIKELLEHLQPGDLIIDGGNSYFKDTDVRTRDLAARGIHFLGVGISGGEEGARHGPSIMPGGSKEAYERVRPIFEAVAAKVNGEACVTWLGPNSAGHFVKMVHNGIEYGMMQLIAETYDLMKRGLGLKDSEISQIYTSWNQRELNSYLMEITSHIFTKKDTQTGGPLIDEILDVAKQKGTGMWTTQNAMELQVPVPTIDQAVAMRDLSVFVHERKLASTLYQHPIQPFSTDRKTFLAHLFSALYAAIILTYTQGLALLKVASTKYKYQIHLEEVAKIWRGGCIIRSALLEDIRAAFRAKPDLPNLLLDPHLARTMEEHLEGLREIVCQAAGAGVPVPAMNASLGYFDAYRSAWLPTNLIQAQRDYFGAHTYERIDTKGTFHMEWEKK